MTHYVCNALSLQMVEMSSGCFHWTELTEKIFKMLSADAESYVGHKDLAKILGVPYHRANLVLEDGDVLYVAQYNGGRLKEGSTELPKGSDVKYFKVDVIGGK